MKIIKLISSLSAVVLLAYLTAFSSCSKEYSCEGCLVTNPVSSTDSLPVDTTIFLDTTKVDNTLSFPVCNTCDSTKPLPLNSWSFKTNNSYVCGTVDNSWFGDTGKNTVDFSGYLQCSRDTGFRIVAFFYPLNFTADRFNVSTTTQSVILQDRINYMNSWVGYILRTNGTTPSHTVRVIVDTFNNSTKLMVGRFYGYTYTKNNEKSYVDGKFRFIVQ